MRYKCVNDGNHSKAEGDAFEFNAELDMAYEKSQDLLAGLPVRADDENWCNGIIKITKNGHFDEEVMNGIIEGNRHIMCCYAVICDWDYMMLVSYKNTQELSDFVDLLREKLVGVNNVNVYFFSRRLI